jgi:hypothetical protein
MKKNICFIIIIFFLSFNSIFSQQKIPIFIPNQNKIFNQISKDIKKNLPDDIELLIFDINMLNATKELGNQINGKFKSILTANQNKYNYNVAFINDLNEEQIGISMNSVRKLSDLEMISLGKGLDKEAVLLSTITLVEDKRRKIWNKEAESYQSKKLALFQGNFFSTINNNSLYRFSYYFLID